MFDTKGIQVRNSAFITVTAKNPSLIIVERQDHNKVVFSEREIISGLKCVTQLFIKLRIYL